MRPRPADRPSAGLGSPLPGRTRRLTAAIPSLCLVLLAGCGDPPFVQHLDAASPVAPDATAPPDAGASPDAGTTVDSALDPTRWQVRVLRDTPRLLPREADGCLAPSPSIVAAGTVLEILAASERHVLLGEDGACLSVDDVEALPRPDPLPPPRTGTVLIDTSRWTYDAAGCPAVQSPLTEGTAVLALARSHDANYRGYVVIDRELGLAPVRHLDAPGWIYPWHAAVQLVKQVPEGFVIGGGILLDASTLLTAGHLGVDGTWCYSREPNTGKAWAAGLFRCDNIDAAAKHPQGVDLARVHLKSPEAPPFATLRLTPLVPGEALTIAKLSQLVLRAFTDTKVKSVGSSNAWCQSWPAASSFILADLVVAGGDSGGPAWIGDELVGIVHGERCKNIFEPVEHVLIHLPGVLDFLQGAP